MLYSVVTGSLFAGFHTDHIAHPWIAKKYQLTLYLIPCLLNLVDWVLGCTLVSEENCRLSSCCDLFGHVEWHSYAVQDAIVYHFRFPETC